MILTAALAVAFVALASADSSSVVDSLQFGNMRDESTHAVKAINATALEKGKRDSAVSLCQQTLTLPRPLW